MKKYLEILMLTLIPFSGHALQEPYLSSIERNFRGNPLVEAAKSPNIKELKDLEARGTDLTRQFNGKGILHIAAAAGSEPVMRYLITEKNFNINAKDDQGMTPLMVFATQRGGILQNKIDIINFLLSKGAQKDIRNNEDKTVIDLLNDLRDKGWGVEPLLKAIEGA